MNIKKLFLAIGILSIFLAQSATCEDRKVTDRELKSLATHSMSGDADAAKELRDFAEQGNADAQFWLWFSYSTRVPRNDEESRKWLLKAAENGQKSAQVNLAIRYSDGTQEFSKNESESFKWYLKAAEQGEPDAQFEVIKFYRMGEIVSKDLIQADKWALIGKDEYKVYAYEPENPIDRMYEYNMKREQILYKRFAEFNDIIEQEMTKEQIVESVRLSNEWVSKNPELIVQKEK